MAANVLSHRRRDELLDRASVTRDLLHQLRGDGLKRDVGHQKNGFDVVVQLLVHASHLELIFEVGDGPQPAQDRGRALLLGEFHQQRVELDDLDVARNVGDLATDDPEPLGNAEHRLLRRSGGDATDELVDEVRDAAGDVEVSARDGVERPRIDCHLHQWSLSVANRAIARSRSASLPWPDNCSIAWLTRKPACWRARSSPSRETNVALPACASLRVGLPAAAASPLWSIRSSAI